MKVGDEVIAITDSRQGGMFYSKWDRLTVGSIRGDDDGFFTASTGKYTSSPFMIKNFKPVYKVRSQPLPT